MNYRDYTEADLDAAREQVADRAGREMERIEERHEKRLDQFRTELAEARSALNGLQVDHIRLGQQLDDARAALAGLKATLSEAAAERGLLCTAAERKVLDAVASISTRELREGIHAPDTVYRVELARRGEKP